MMKKALVFALVAVACAACRPPSGELAESSTESASTRSAAEGAGPGRFASAAGRVSFASLPDRGDLLAYPRPTPARQTGAYTWHRAELSEAHAFQSLQSGSLRVTSPSGQPLEYEYVRHVEHPSGDWTWIGRLKGGAPSDEAVITFGERAAFGSIAEPGKPPLRVTTSAGAAWIVETDPVKVAAIDNEATRPSRPDYLLPPEQAASLAAADTSATAASAPSTSAAVAAAATTVDVVVGYTAGFASALGGTSQAVTRLNNMVETTNQAYANSQVDAAIRMVHALQVSYPDNTANGATLESLTGYRSGTGQIPVDPAFSALRAARDQYGGDLVTLVRRFQTPENDGCGIAWLIGGDQTGIDTGDAPFGYSVVSDGTDVDTDGKTYFCREETLAHELGHNMGLQHDRISATENGQLTYGVFAYSFGYKSTATGANFYTVMAYGDTGQASFRVFSNPRITFCGVPCGVADQADNARSLAQTMPIVAMFRGQVAPPPSGGLSRILDSGDFDGNGASDLLWRSSANGANVLWKGASVAQALATVADQNWKVVGVGDFGGDGRSDIVWRHAVNGANTIWNSGTTGQALARVADASWKIVGVGDFDADGRSDLLWRNDVNGANALWRSGTVGQSLTTVADQNWKVVAVGDFDGNGQSDIAWRNMATGANEIWKGADSAARQVLASVSSQSWQILGAGDFDGDGRSDLLWRNSANGANSLWKSGTVGQVLTSWPDQAWQVAALGDFNGDARTDIMWRNNATGANQIWNSGGSTTPRSLATVALSWRVVPYMQ